MKKGLILIVALILTLTVVFADGGDDPKDQTDSTLLPVSDELIVDACSTTDI